MGLNISNKVIDKNTIECGEDFFVTLSLSASPDIKSNPADIVLMLDRSSSMGGVPLEEAKLGAKSFIDIIAKSTDGTQGEIGNCSKIGMVSFSTIATKDLPLTTSVADLNLAIDALGAGGNTNHSDAFKKARELFDPQSQNNKVIVMFTDGNTTVGSDPSLEAKAARDEGIIVYCIGLGSDIDADALNDWATDPDSTHVSIAPNPEDLKQIFENLAVNISKPGATNIVIEEFLNEEFNIVEVLSPTSGNATLINNNVLKWTIPELGKTSNEGTSLKFRVEYVGNSSGVFPVNKTIQYTDNEGNIANFANPEITINCTQVIPVNPCPTPRNITFNGCQEYIEYDLGNYTLSDLGRILELSLTIKNICPNKRVAVAITLNEVDDQGLETKRGMKVIRVPAHSSIVCEDVKLTNIKFVLPEENGQLGKRKFVASVILNYIDNNQAC
ncbi:vWA domain-containing protein [uncultured Tyzzerella sp.]|uniref:vWA domain-containing protein n=1 Tax=uncultured Tyzzerella sp. TaxID=2321398 RepID=UPI002943AC6C|nr:vWA domain-containing protein [uncultured Tyzzerella sp.]